MARYALVAIVAVLSGCATITRVCDRHPVGCEVGVTVGLIGVIVAASTIDKGHVRPAPTWTAIPEQH